MSHCLPPDICFLCLSRNRKTFTLSANFHNLFDFLTDWYPQTDARVCWECRATLEKLRRFKEQAERAVCALERARTGLQPMSFECLSKVFRTQMLVIDLLVYDDANVITTNDCSVDISKTEICKAYKVEAEFEDEIPKIKDKITEEVDLGEDIIYENIIPDHTAEDDNDNDVGSDCLMIDLTEDDTENAIEHNTKPINLPQSILQIDSPPTSAEDTTSKNEKNSSAIKKARGAVKTKVKKAQCNVKTKIEHKKQMVRKIKKTYTAAERLINKKRRAEEQKYILFQNGKAFECDHCGKKSVKRKKLIQHIRRHYKNFMCRQCGFKCTYPYVMKKHMLAHHNLIYRPEDCGLCPESFIDKYAEEQKYILFQKGKDFECDHCGKKYVRRQSLINHIKEHFKNIMCDQCAYKCTAIWDLKKHMLSHLERKHKPLQCELCDKRYATKYKLIVHIRSHTGERPFKCDYCDNTFVSKESLKTHVEKRHIDSDTLVEHYYSTHKNRIPCAECNRTFRFLSELKHHVIIVHRGERPYQCNICGASSITKTQFQVHMDSHSNERRFKCDECTATFKFGSGLWYHKLVHKGVKPHQCNICGARFTVKGNLVGHMKVHTKDRPYECDICSKKFPWKRNLKNHLKTHLKE